MWQDLPQEKNRSMEVSMRAWQKPYDILLKEAINRTKTPKGARLEKMFYFIRCKYRNMKYKRTRKGLGKALRRMIASGHIEQPCPGYYKMSRKPIYYMPCMRFDRTICGQQEIKKALLRARKKGKPKKNKRNKRKKRKKRKVRKWKRKRRKIRRSSKKRRRC